MNTRSIPPRHSRRLRLTVALTATAAVAATAVISGFGVVGSSATEEHRNGAGRMDVVASFYPLEYLARTIGGDHVEVTGLTAPGIEPHDLELSPKQAGTVASADLVLHLKGFQPSVDAAAEQADRSRVTDAAALSPPVDHGAEGLDPHLWLDPTHYAAVAEGVGARLAAVDPAHAVEYRANTAALTGRLKALDAEFRTGLKNCASKDFLTGHAAFGYLADAYGLRQIPVSGIDPASEPSAARLAEVEREAREHRVGTVFTETLASPRVAETLAQELGLKTAVLDPLEGVDDGHDYFSVMRANLGALRDALGCTS